MIRNFQFLHTCHILLAINCTNFHMFFFFFSDAFGVILSRAELFLLMKTLEWDETEGVRNLLAHWDKMPKAQRGFYVAQAMRIVGGCCSVLVIFFLRVREANRPYIYPPVN